MNAEPIGEKSDMLDYIAEFFGPVIGAGIAEITVIIAAAVIIALLDLMLFAIFRAEASLASIHGPIGRTERGAA